MSISRRLGVNKAMKKLGNPKITYSEALSIIYSIEADLIQLLPDHQASEKDYRLGGETYGYESEEKILGNLFYISDRWGCAFRIAWMLGIVNKDYR